MLNAYRLTHEGPKQAGDPAEVLGKGGHGWVDLFAPSAEEDKATERFLGASIPTREEAQEIEFSSRFYVEDGAVFMTPSVLTGFDVGAPKLTPLTFVLGKDRIATVRHDDFVAFRQFLGRAGRPEMQCDAASGIFLALTEAIVDRLADVVEKISTEIDTLNIDIFKRGTLKRRERKLDEIISILGRKGDIVAKARESLASLERLAQFAGAVRTGVLNGEEDRERLKLITRDVRSLTDQLGFLSNRIFFLLDATLGLISVSQNEVIRVLTIVATFFFPPTLIGTIYGMNFVNMPERDWVFGYPLAIVLMVVTAIVPYLYFKRRGWF